MRWRSAALLPAVLLVGCGGELPNQRADPAGDVVALGERSTPVRAPEVDRRRATVERTDGRVRVDVDVAGTTRRADDAVVVSFTNGGDPLASVTVGAGTPATLVGADGRATPARVTRRGSHLRLEVPGAALATADDWQVAAFDLGGSAADLLPDAREDRFATHPEITVIR